MSYSDSLENNLKALERLEEKDPEQVRRDQQRRESDRNAALLRAPHVEALKTSAFTSNLLTACRTIAHGQKLLVQIAWVGDNLRLDARNRIDEKTKRLELTPTPEGIEAIISEDGTEIRRNIVNPASDDATVLAQGWLVS